MATRSRIGFGALALAVLATAGCADQATPVAPDLDVLAAKSGMAMGHNKMADHVFVAQLTPLNARVTERAATGRATITVKGDWVTIEIDAKGLLPNRVHPQHIHGWDGGMQNATCPSPQADTNRDGILDIGEGLPFYGPVQLSLTPFPTADDMFRVHYTRTYSVMEIKEALGISDLAMLDRFAIVLHGGNVNGEYWLTLPVACGEIRQHR